MLQAFGHWVFMKSLFFLGKYIFEENQQCFLRTCFWVFFHRLFFFKNAMHFSLVNKCCCFEAVIPLSSSFHMWKNQHFLKSHVPPIAPFSLSKQMHCPPKNIIFVCNQQRTSFHPPTPPAPIITTTTSSTKAINDKSRKNSKIHARVDGVNMCTPDFL